MELQHVNVKLYLENPEDLNLETLIPVFHSWIQEQALEELLIDVADYRHVYGGPGVILVGHEADYSVDNSDHRLGVRYNRKAVLEGDNYDRFSQALRAALRATQRLESDERLRGQVRFNRQEVKFFVNDRMVAPNVEQTYSVVEPDLARFLEHVAESNEFMMQRETDPRRLFGISVKFVRPIVTDRLLERLR
jgi:hypothetical protein